MDSVTNTVQFAFTTKRHIEEHFDSITFDYESNAADLQVFGPDSTISVRITESRVFWVQIGIALFLFSSLSVVIGADFASISPLSPKNVFEALWAKALAGLVQAGVVFWLFRLIGKKIF